MSNSISQRLEKLAIALAEKMGKNATRKDSEIDPSSVNEVAQNLDKMNRGPIAQIWDKVTALWEAFKSTETPLSKKILIIGGLIYLVTPIDVIPDVIVPLGLLDDVAVIAFVYAQCKSLIEKKAPQITTQIKDTVYEITDNAVVNIVAKQFQMFSVRTLINAFLRLVIFSASLAILSFAPKGINIATVAAAVFMAASSAWIIYNLIHNITAITSFAKRFLPEFRRIRAHKSQSSAKAMLSSETRHGKQREFWNDTAQAIYNSLVTSDFETKHSKLARAAAFLFRRWNEGKLPPWIPGKHELAQHVWNTIKIQLIFFFAMLTGYFIAYHLFVVHLMGTYAERVSLWVLLASPFTYAWQLLTS